MMRTKVKVFSRVADLDPYQDWIRSQSGSRRAKMTHKRRKFLKSSCFEVLDEKK
jgi:hypothetical protein